MGKPIAAPGALMLEELRIRGVMKFPIAQPGFEGQNIAIETAGFFRAARLLQNGNPVARRAGRYALRSNAGDEVQVQLRSNFVDPVPQVKFGSKTIALAVAVRALIARAAI